MIKLSPSIKNNSHFKDDDLICYCFKYTKKDIEIDFNKNGYSTILEEIKKEKSIGGCKCEVKNPKGK
jgi:NAD(P)H-nitrite reductase large subunit